MSAEVILFLVVGVISIAAAIMMLLTENAVHSALFLILNFLCIAVLFLALDASFLALVQIAVYAGAIMVLFLFVIMLLGAENTGDAPVRQFQWLAPLAMALAVVFLAVMTVALNKGDLDAKETPLAAPNLRVINATQAFDAIDVYVDDELVFENVELELDTDNLRDVRYVALTAGDHAVAINEAGDDPSLAFPSETVTLVDGDVVTLVAYGADIPELGVVHDDLSTFESGGQSRIAIFNAYSGADSLDVINVNRNFTFDDAASEPPEVAYSDLALGSATTMAVRREGKPYWAIIPSGDFDADSILYRFRNLEFEGDTSQLLVVASQPDEFVEGGVRPVVMSLITRTDPQFGGPESVGELLFVKYLLPFQMVAILLLAAMVGAIVVTQRGDIRPKPGRPTRRKVSRPLTSVIASQTGSSPMAQDLEQLEAPPPVDEPEPAGD
jgi:NADH:ubiquinone oxidoreductase subunit 6 (subunit J)